MDKEKRKKDIAFMSIAAGMAAKCRKLDGVVGPSEYLDQSNYPAVAFKTGMLMMPSGFLEYFGDDTDFEYIDTEYGDIKMVTEVNGVIFYAIVDNKDRIPGGYVL